MWTKLLTLKSEEQFANTNLNEKHVQTAHNIPFLFVQN